MTFYLGTSGYHYDSWVHTFYPAGNADFLSYYAKYFNSVEINSTFYRIFPPDFFMKMTARVPPNFKFFIKVNQNITHVQDRTVNDDIRAFNASLKQMVKTPYYGGILLQFPFSFKYNKDSMKYLDKLVTHLPVKQAVEFRHHSWNNELVLKYCSEKSVSVVNVDIPPVDELFPPLELVTSDMIYFRMHGRAAEKWWNYREPHERYDYYYSEEEIRGIKDRIEKSVKDKPGAEVYIFFNNHYQAKAVKNALQLGNSLGILKNNPTIQESLF